MRLHQHGYPDTPESRQPLGGATGRGAVLILVQHGPATEATHYARRVAAYRVFVPDAFEFTPPSGVDQQRQVFRLSNHLRSTRANVWRMLPGARGRRHLERVQEELFVVLEGTARLLLGDPGELVELPRGSLAIVEPNTPLQLLNDGDVDAVVLIVGAPPVEGEAEYLPE